MTNMTEWQPWGEALGITAALWVLYANRNSKLAVLLQANFRSQFLLN